MEEAKSKPLSSLVFIPLLALIFLRPFLSGLAYPVLENYSQNCLITLAIIALFFNRKERVRNPYGLAIALLMLSYLVSAAFSVNIRNSISEIIKFISYLSLFFLVSQGDEKQRKITIKTIVIAASIISLYSIYQYFVGYQHTLDYLEKIKSDFLLNSSYARDILIDKRAIGTFPSPNLLGGYLIVCFFLSLVLIKNNMLNKKWYIAPFLIIVALILTKSMGAWLSLISGIIILFLLSYKYLKQRRLILALSSIVIISVLAFILISRWERLGNIENPQNSITQRLNYWRTAIAIIKDRPITGVGPGNFKEVFLN
ncbi:MAG: O-antigen ligase family protein, partial [Candidatus Omnitrophica bacterium]|nr:O-antigen ligase family protein [Candidatus Omnitrophota bacterium]